MADEIDRAQDYQIQFNELALRRPKDPGLPAIGLCHYCSESVPGQQVFCDSECADAHAQEQLMRRRNGASVNGA